MLMDCREVGVSTIDLTSDDNNDVEWKPRVGMEFDNVDAT